MLWYIIIIIIIKIIKQDISNFLNILYYKIIKLQN